eukprot:Gb_41094 [translate_table: standard]
MEIGEDVTESLRSSSGNDDNLRALATAAISVIAEHRTEESALSGAPFDAMDVDFIKRTYSALVCVYLEAAHKDLSTQQLLSYLRADCGLSDSTSTMLCDLFVDSKQELRKVLSRTANHSYLRQVTGVDWKLDYCVSTSEDKDAKELLYFLGLKTLDTPTDSNGNIEFVCSVEQLQDLVVRLKDACKSVERGADKVGTL